MGKSKGYVKLDRSIQGHWIWQEKPYDKAHAWVDLILLANYEDTKELYRGKLVYRKRGQIHCSSEWLATRYGWSRGKVDRYLKLLEADNMVEVKRTPYGTTITIVNYTLWQGARATDGTTHGTTHGATDGTTDGTTDGHTKESKRKEKKLERIEELKHPEWA